jgi:hypothetical protein
MIPAMVLVDTGLVVALIVWGVLVTALVAGTAVSELRWPRLPPRFLGHA